MSVSVAKAMHKELDPALGVKAGNEKISLVPGTINYLHDSTQGPAAYPIAPVQHNIQATDQVIQRKDNDIREGLYVNLFRMLLDSDRRPITATEVAAREEEKLLMLGPVLERLNDELFDPAITRVFNVLYRLGLPEKQSIFHARMPGI